MFTVGQLVTLFGGQALLLAAVGALIRMYLNHKLLEDAEKFKAELQRRSDEFRIQLQSTADVELEKLKALLQQTATENQIRFAKLHEERATFVKELYQRLVAGRRDAAQYVWGDSDNRQAAAETQERLLEIYRFIADNRIFLPDSICRLVDAFEHKLRTSVISVDVYFARVSPHAVLSAENQAMRSKVIIEASEFLETSSNVMLEELAKEFRLLLGDKPQPFSTQPKN